MADELHKYSEDELVCSFEKMSKSKGTGIAPRDLAQKYGVDTLRMAIMFGAPPEHDLNFDESILQNMKSFLDRVAKAADTFSSTSTHGSIDLTCKDFQDLLKLLIDYELKLTEQRFFHVSIARIMEMFNIISKQESSAQKLLHFALLIRALYPFSPHLAA